MSGHVARITAQMERDGDGNPDSWPGWVEGTVTAALPQTDSAAHTDWLTLGTCYHDSLLSFGPTALSVKRFLTAFTDLPSVGKDWGLPAEAPHLHTFTDRQIQVVRKVKILAWSWAFH